MKPNDVTLPWLLRLRWAAITGQTATIVFCRDVLRLRLPLAPLLAVLLVALSSQLLLWFLPRRLTASSPAILGGVLALDTLLLTALLFFTGGPHNPFSAFYLIHIAMAASILGTGWTWALLVLAVTCFGALFWRSIPLPFPTQEEAICGLMPMQLHFIGMFVALALAGICLAWIVARLNTQFCEQAAALHQAEMKAERESRFASLTTLATGVAHEISSPLATIAVAARELEREAELGVSMEGLVEDARLIRMEVERCRDILGRLRANASDGPHEPAVDCQVHELANALRASLSTNQSSRLELADQSSNTSFRAPRASLLQALSNLISNAVDATPPGSPVRLEVSRNKRELAFTVCDQGPGLAAEVAARIGEPFVTTKEPGKGTGLGLFLVRRFAEQIGGRLEIQSSSEYGTRARLEIPHGESI